MKNKKIISILIIWTFIHSFLLINNDKEEIGELVEDLGMYITNEPKDFFYPFTYKPRLFNQHFFDSDYYDFSEYFVYVVGAWSLFLIYSLLYKEEEKSSELP